MVSRSGLPLTRVADMLTRWQSHYWSLSAIAEAYELPEAVVVQEIRDFAGLIRLTLRPGLPE